MSALRAEGDLVDSCGLGDDSHLPILRAYFGSRRTERAFVALGPTDFDPIPTIRRACASSVLW